MEVKCTCDPFVYTNSVRTTCLTVVPFIHDKVSRKSRKCRGLSRWNSLRLEMYVILLLKMKRHLSGILEGQNRGRFSADMCTQLTCFRTARHER